MKYEITKEQILEAHKDACGDWKKKIESWFPGVFKNTLELNKWYKKSNTVVMFHVTEIDNDGYVSAYGINYEGKWSSSSVWFNCKPMREDIIPATDTEVSEMLKKEFKKIGFEKGIKVKCAKDGTEWTLRKGVDCLGIFNSIYNSFTDGSGAYWFWQGKFATIVEQPTEMTHAEIEKALGKKIKIVTK